VLTRPLLTVVGFIADPDSTFFLNPLSRKSRQKSIALNFNIHQKPNWHTYKIFLEFSELIMKDTSKFHPKEMIDIQSFIWVLGPEEYPD